MSGDEKLIRGLGLKEATALNMIDMVGVGPFITIGQYLQPTAQHVPVARFYHPDEFAQIKREAYALGFKHVEAGPLVRSSYHAHEQEAAASATPA